MRRSPWSRAIMLVLALVLVCTSVLAVPQTAQAASKPKEITLSAKNRTLYVGKSFSLKVKSVKPANASKAVTFKSSNTKVATVNSKGKVTGKKVGKATITVTSTSNKSVKATCKVTVKQQVESISVTNAIRRKVVVPKGKTLTLKTVVKPDNAANKGLNYTVGKPKIVTVNANGKIKANKYGSNRIAIQSKDKQKRLVIVVYVPRIRIKSVALNTTKKSLNIGKTYQLEGIFKPSNASVKVVSFKSSNPKVASVGTFGKVKALSPGKSVITMTTLDGKKTAKCTITVNPVKVTGVTVIPESQELVMGQQFTVSARIAPSNATNQAVTWKSSNTDVVRVTQAGLATAVGVGEVEITATAKDGSGKSGKCKVTVVPEGGKLLVRSIKVVPEEKALNVGETATLEAVVTLDDGTVVTESNKDKYPLSWVSDRPDVATVEPETGKVTAIAVGTANISAVALDGSEEMGTCRLTVSAGQPSVVPEIILQDEKINLQVGGTKDLAYTVTQKDVPITWSSNDESVATVADGKVTAKKEGTAIITAYIKGGNTATCTVNVTSNVPRIELTEVEVNLQVGGTIALKWAVSPANAAVTWTVNDEGKAVASVDDKGVITAKAEGTAVVTASVAGGNSVKCTVNVIPKQDASEIVLVQEEVNLEVGDEITLKWSVKPENAAITWGSSNPNVAEVTEGTIKAKAEGTTIISAAVEGGNTVTCAVNVKAPKQETPEITLTQVEVSLIVGEEMNLKWSVKPEGTDVIWSSKTPSIATVENGKITAVSEGITDITATAGNTTVTCTVNVKAPEQPEDPETPEIILAEKKVNLQVGEKMALTYSVRPAGTVVNWASDDPNVATVENGEITAKSVGTATITASVDEGNVVTCIVNVTPKQETTPELILKEASVRMRVGQEMALTWTVTPADAEILWEIDDDEVATVENGKIVALKAGTAKITGSVAGGNQVICNLTVDGPVITLTQVEVNLQVGAEMKLSWAVDPENTEVTWKSEDETVATVVDGVIKAVGIGETTITATAEGGNSVKCIVNVVGAVLTLEEESLNLVAGLTRKLTWSVEPQGTKVTWSSNNEEVATVNENGEVTAVSEGTATIKGVVDGGNSEVTCVVTVTGVSIALNEKEIRLETNQEGFQLTTTLKPEDLKEAIIIWSSDHEDVARVSNGLVTPREILPNEVVDPVRTATITAMVQINGKTVAMATCEVTVIAEESAEVQDDDNFIYALGADAEAYRIERTNPATQEKQIFEVAKEDVAHDLALFAQKLNSITWDNNFLKNYWDRFNTESLKESNILSLLFLIEKPEIKDIDAFTKEITMRGHTMTVKRVDGQNSSSLIITDKDGSRQAYVEDIQATSDGSNVKITAQIGASATGKRMGIELTMSLDGKNITFSRVVNNKIRPVVSFSQLENGSFEFKVNQMYYDEFVDMFGSDLDYLSQLEIYNIYY